MRHIVLADDNHDHCFIFEKVVQHLNKDLCVTCVHDSGELLQLLDQTAVDLLFLDLRMPSKNGFECLKAIRSNSRLQKLTVIIYSHSSSRNDIERAFMEKADLYIVKPFELSHLTNVLRIILRILLNPHANCTGTISSITDLFLLQLHFKCFGNC